MMRTEDYVIDFNPEQSIFRKNEKKEEMLFRLHGIANCRKINIWGKTIGASILSAPLGTVSGLVKVSHY